MWTAYIIAVVLGQAVKGVDPKGPYEAEKQCVAALLVDIAVMRRRNPSINMMGYCEINPRPT